MPDIIDKEFEGNVRIVITEGQAQIWVCKEGQNIFRFKFIGKVYGKGNDFITIDNEKN